MLDFSQKSADNYYNESIYLGFDFGVCSILFSAIIEDPVITGLKFKLRSLQELAPDFGIRPKGTFFKGL